MIPNAIRMAIFRVTKLEADSNPETMSINEVIS